MLIYRASLNRTFKTEYQPPTGAASESSKSEKDLLLFLLPGSVPGHFALFRL